MENGNLPSVTNQFEIPLDTPINEFAKHLADDKNKRTIISGPFGTGKTYFLNKFFEHYSDQYRVITLRPINYSISLNEDVFELIKYDILLHLLAHPLKFDKVNFSTLTSLEWYIHDNPITFVKGFLGIATKLGQSVPYEVAEKLLDLFVLINKEFKEYHNSHQTDDLKTAKNYLKAQTIRKGSIYEEDQITILINKLLDQLTASDKKTVLIIDDLDRIDPEHIFRLLNIFASHNNSYTDENKFNFNKVVFVCDINNIRQIFSSKYGTNVDFSGYIDKFYSREIFYFDNNDVVTKHVGVILKSLFVQGQDDEDIIRHLLSFQSFNFFSESVAYLIGKFIEKRVINLRKVTKIAESYYPFSLYEKKFSIMGDASNDYDSNYEFLSLYKFLVYFLGGHDELISGLEQLSKVDSNIYIGKIRNRRTYEFIVKGLLGSAISILDIENNKKNRHPDTITTYTNDQFINFNYSFYHRNVSRTTLDLYGELGMILKIHKRDENTEINYIDLFMYLRDAFTKLQILRNIE